MKQIIEMLKALKTRKFFGKLTITIENGRILRTVTEESTLIRDE